MGGSKPIAVNIRFISATNRNFQQQLSDGHFREDLCYRLNVFAIQIPPARKRLDDIAPLPEHFIAKLATSEGKALRRLSVTALDFLMEFDWPGNVWQLENPILRTVVLCDSNQLALTDFPQIAQSMGMDAPMATNEGGNGGLSAVNATNEIRTLEALEADRIYMAIDKYDGKITEVVRRLRIGRSTLYRKFNEFGIDVVR